ncbi:hypothetical protein [Thiomicrorhabdus cannonii]|uniref:hypothetical protein n=1 Tax=Thiomicrorhabdus cannonii TaxID=2748011 RepID=UPI0015B99C32|nr:hypothetical protein [Thiomicrorhabdus cannonii]
MAKVFESYQLHAYVDGQLSREECLEIELAMQLQPELEQEIAQLRALKAQVKEMYQDIAVPEKVRQSAKPSRVWSLPKTVAASLVLGAFLGAGSLQVYLNGTTLLPMTQQQVAEGKYLIHLDSDDHAKQALALQEVERLLQEGGSHVKVDFISNYQGVTLFDVNNPNRQELEGLLSKYDNLTLYACKRALERAMEKGQTLQMLPQVRHEQPAIDAVAQRLSTGWKYIKI